jgi:hypothetical protein
MGQSGAAVMQKDHAGKFAVRPSAPANRPISWIPLRSSCEFAAPVPLGHAVSANQERSFPFILAMSLKRK